MHVDYLRLLLVSIDFNCIYTNLLSATIEKLELVFPKCRSKRKYSCVGFDYGTIVDQIHRDEIPDELDEMELKTGQGHEILSEQDKITLDQLNKQKVNATYIRRV